MFRPGKTGRVTGRILMARTLISNFYLYDTGDGYAAFDCGLSPLLAGSALKKLGVDPAQVKAVFLTHSDMDHKGGLGLFPQATVYLPANEVPMITGKKARRFIVYNSGIKHYQTLAHGQTVALGDTEIELVAAPGHTPGSACYRVGQDTVATGDLLLIGFGGRVGQFSIVQNMDHAGNLATLKRLTAEGLFTGVKHLLTGHSGVGVVEELSF